MARVKETITVTFAGPQGSGKTRLRQIFEGQLKAAALNLGIDVVIIELQTETK